MEGQVINQRIEHSKMGDAKKKAEVRKGNLVCHHIYKEMLLGKMKKAFATEEDKKGKGSGTKDACYHKVKGKCKGLAFCICIW